MSNECLQSWTAAPDYFRTKVSGPKKIREAIDAIRYVQGEDASRAGKLRPWTFQGWKGVASPSVRWGVRDLSLIWESSGEITPFTMTRLQPFIGSGKRLDLQTTWTFSSGLPSFGAWCLKSSTRTTKRQRPNGTLVGRWKRTDGAFVGQVGKRTHPEYFRVYDKGVESNSAPIGHKWRLELETKGTLAEDLCRLPVGQLTDPQFCARYLTSSWARAGFSLPLTNFAERIDVLSVRRRPPSPAGALLMWTSTTVRPAVERLLTVFTVEDVLSALGLSDVATSRRKYDANS